MSERLDEWDIVAPLMEGLNCNTGAPNEDEGRIPSNAEWQTIFQQFTGVNTGFVPLPRSFARNHDSINDAIDFTLNREANRDTPVYGFMLYDARVNDIVYSWTEQEAINARTYVDSIGRSDIRFLWDARGYIQDRDWFNVDVIDDIVIEGSVPKWLPTPQNGRDQILQELWTDPGLHHKRIIFQIPHANDSPSFYQGVREFMRWLATDEMDFEFMRSDRVVFQICNYNSHPHIPEVNAAGSEYEDSLLGICLMLIEQRAFFEGRAARLPTAADDADRTRHGVIPSLLD